MQPTAFLEQLGEDTGIARQLLELIDAEHQALAERRLTDLETLLSAKQPLLALLNQHASLRSQALAEHGLDNNRDGLERFAQATPECDQILACATELEQALQACHEANERNGRLIHANQASVVSMLDILQHSGTSPSLYDRRGGSTKSSQQRPLSQA
jgi:flagella synthesis protein FlgN